MPTTMEKLINAVIEWAKARNIIKGSTPIKQHDKLLEEVMELRDGIVRDNELSNRWLETEQNVISIINRRKQIHHEIKDAIGDCTVCLINLAKMQDMNFQECLQQAYDEIKDRKGKMINGTFVKESDLKD